MDLTPMLRQQVEWLARLGSNNRGESTFAEAVAVYARKVPKYRDIVSAATGEVVTTSTLVTMIEQPAIGDTLDGREVIQVDGMVDFTGVTVGWQALTR